MTAVDILYPTSQAMELLKNQGTENPVESLKYFCKICGKKFVSGRALGGHMRAHMPACMHADKFTESEFRKSKRTRVSDDRSMENNGENLMFALQRNPKRETQDEESDKHETQDGDIDTEIEMEIDQSSGNLRRFDKWVKEKRFKTPIYALQCNPHAQFVSATNNEEEDMALCLVMLASGVNTAQNTKLQVGATDLQSVYLELPNNVSQLPKSIRKKVKYKKINEDDGLYDEAKKGGYKCTTCSKIFHSYQALGGHSASHVKFKGCFTHIEDENESLEEDITDELSTGSCSQLPGNFHKPPPKERTKDSSAKARDGTRTIEPAEIKKTPRVHECSICNRGFASCQALGGHKRCHWGTGASDTITTTCAKETPMQQQMPAGRVELLDLNLPAPFDDDSEAGNLNNFDGNAVDSHGTSHAQTHSRHSLLSSLMGNHQKQGLLLYNNDSHLSKDDEADSKVGKGIGFGRGCDSESPVRAQSWLQL